MNINQDLELLNVYTEDNETKIGIADRGVVHYFNLWHREIACWILNEKNEILLQRRSSIKKQQPNMLAVTTGHVDLNESPIEATLREVKEELGIDDLEQKELIFIDTFKAKNPNNYHYKYVYFLKIPVIKRYTLKIRRRLEIINIDDEYNTRKDSAKILTKALAIVIPVAILTIVIAHTNYLLMFIVLIFELFMIDTLIDGSIDKKDTNLLKEQIVKTINIPGINAMYGACDKLVWAVCKRLPQLAIGG